jgi:hypothetical protein
VKLRYSAGSPLEDTDAVAVLFVTSECREVVAQLLDDFLKNLRVNLFRATPSLLEAWQEFLLGVRQRIIVPIQSVEEVVVDQSTGIDSPHYCSSSASDGRSR